MSRISADDVRKVAQLARLDLPEQTIATFTPQLAERGPTLPGGMRVTLPDLAPNTAAPPRRATVKLWD